MQKLDNSHIPFLKKKFFMLTESNSRNILSEIITNNLEILLIKIYRFQWDFSLQIFSHCLRNQTLSYKLLRDLPKGSSVPFNLLCTSVTGHFLQNSEFYSFFRNYLLQRRHLPSSSILDKLKKEEDCIANAAVYLVIFISYHLYSQ